MHVLGDTISCTSEKIDVQEWDNICFVGGEFQNIIPGSIRDGKYIDVSFKMIYHTNVINLQANVSATIRLFGGDSSHTPFFDWQRFQDNTLYPLAIIHMEHINVLDFDDKSERNLCFSYGNSGIIFNGASAQLFPPREKW